MTANLQSQGTISHIVSLRPSLHLQHHSAKYNAFLADFPSITNPCLPPQPGKHNVTHHVNTTGLPVYAKARRLPPDLLRTLVLLIFKHMLEQEIIQPSNSQWSSPLQMVLKKTPGDWQCCGDY